MLATIDHAGRRFSRTLARATLAPVIGLILFALILIGIVTHLLVTMYWINHSNNVISKSQFCEKLLLDVQTATRGYYLTLDTTFLKPYTDARPNVRQQLEELRQSVDDSDEQTARATRFGRAANDWLLQVDADVLAARTLDHPPSVEVIRRDKSTFDDIRDQVRDLIGYEFRLRETRSRTAIRSSFWVVGSALFVTVVLGLLQAISTRRSLRDVSENYRETLELSEHRNHLVRDALRGLDEELKEVGEIQRSLLPIDLPQIPGLRLAASYQTSKRVGGDYYDFVPLPPIEGDAEDRPPRWGILIADVSGHGTPAAVLMAVTHAVVHQYARTCLDPADVLGRINRRLCDRYTLGSGSFVTAFYAIYDPTERRLTYSCAGHNPPRVRRDGENEFDPLDNAQGLPLGVLRDEQYETRAVFLGGGDLLVLYTDGIIEARDPKDVLYGTARLDAVVGQAPGSPDELIKRILMSVSKFTHQAPQEDDRTVLILQSTINPDDHTGDSRRAVVGSVSSISEDVEM